MGSDAQVTAADREKAAEIVHTWFGGAHGRPQTLEQLRTSIATTVADERAKARAPFLALAERFAALAYTTEARVSYDDRAEYRADQIGLAMGYTRAALAIRRAAQDPPEVRET